MDNLELLKEVLKYGRALGYLKHEGFRSWFELTKREQELFGSYEIQYLNFIEWVYGEISRMRYE